MSLMLLFRARKAPPVPPPFATGGAIESFGGTKRPKRKENRLAMIQRSDEDFLQLIVALMPFIDRE